MTEESPLDSAERIASVPEDTHEDLREEMEWQGVDPETVSVSIDYQAGHPAQAAGDGDDDILGASHPWNTDEGDELDALRFANGSTLTYHPNCRSSTEPYYGTSPVTTAQSFLSKMSKAQRNSYYGQNWYKQSVLQPAPSLGIRQNNDRERWQRLAFGRPGWLITPGTDALDSDEDPWQPNAWPWHAPDPNDLPGEPAEVQRCPVCDSRVDPGGDGTIERGDDWYCTVGCLNEEVGG